MTGVVDEKDERAYMAPPDSSPEPSPFSNSCFPLSARSHSFDLLLQIGQIICFMLVMNSLVAPLLAGLYAVESLTPLWGTDISG